MVPKTILFTWLVGAGLGLPGMFMVQSGEPVNPTTLGPQVGETVPDFTLMDHRGKERTLESLYGPKGLMLFFNRSADW